MFLNILLWLPQATTTKMRSGAHRNRTNPHLEKEGKLARGEKMGDSTLLHFVLL